MNAAEALKAAHAAGVHVAVDGEDLVLEASAMTTPAPETAGVLPSAPSVSSAAMPEFNPRNGFAAPPLRTVPDGADDTMQPSPATVRTTVRANPLKTNVADDADDADANLPAQSAPEKTLWRGVI